MKKSVKFSGVIDRICDGKALLLASNGREIFLPADNLPEGASEGSVVSFTAALDDTAQSERLKKVKILRKALEGKKGEEENAD